MKKLFYADILNYLRGFAFSILEQAGILRSLFYDLDGW